MFNLKIILLACVLRSLVRLVKECSQVRCQIVVVEWDRQKAGGD